MKPTQSIPPENSYDRKEVFKEEIKECSGYKYSQSSKVSSLSRTIIYAIIGLIWAFSFNSENGGFNLQNRILIWAFFFSLFFLIIDITHYFVDTIHYHGLICLLERSEMEITATREKYENKKEIVEDVSHIFLIIKYILMIVTASIFITGMLVKILPLILN